MGLESATYISQLVTTNPVGATDLYSTADDHLRLIKSVLQNQFPNFGAAAVTATPAELNTMDGITSTTAELNKLDGFTGVVADLNVLAGASAGGLTAAELLYVAGVTSDIQTQLNNKQPLDSDLTAIAALSTTTHGRSLLTDIDAAASRTTLGLGSLATANTVNNANWSGTDLSVANGGTGASTLTGVLRGNGTSAVTGGTISGSDWSGTDLAVADGGTGASTASAARTNLGAIGTGDSPTFGTVTLTNLNIGATDTTITRSRAGEADIEGRPLIQHDSSSMTGGRIRVQNGGTPTGGNNGDIWLIY